MLHKKTPLIRASSVSKIMTDPRSCSDAVKALKDKVSDAKKAATAAKKISKHDYETAKQFLEARNSELEALINEESKSGSHLSETAKSHLFDLVKQAFYERDFYFSNKYTKKGLMCEEESIALYNEVHGTNLAKVPDEARAYLDGLTGCPDLILSDGKNGVDIKTAWSLETFPMLPCEVDAKGYEWQARAYMALYDSDTWQIAYCLVDTPDELLKYVSEEEFAVHKSFEFVPAKHRITSIMYKRDYDEEAKMFDRVKKAREFMSDLLFKMEGK